MNEMIKDTLMSSEAVRSMVGEDHTAVVDLVLDAWASWTEHAALRPVQHPHMTERTRASYVHDEFVRLAKIRFAGTDVSCVMEEDVFYLVFGDSVRLRHKKLDRNGKPRNYPTTRAKGLANQLWLIPEVGYGEDATIVIAGYQLDESGTKVEKIKITCMRGSAIEWSYRIYDRAQAVPFEPLVQKSAQRKTTVRAKKTPEPTKDRA